MRQTLILLAMAALLSGCSLLSEPRVVIQTERVYTPDELLTDSPIPPPPDKALYKASKPSVREKLLVDYAGSLLDVLDAEHVKHQKARDLKKGP